MDDHRGNQQCNPDDKNKHLSGKPGKYFFTGIIQYKGAEENRDNEGDNANIKVRCDRDNKDRGKADDE